MCEINRIKQVYEERKTVTKADYNPVLPENNYFIISKEKILAKLIFRFLGTSPGSLKILDVGFGSGSDILTLIKYGFNVKNIHGVEILPERFNRVNEMLPTANLKLTEGFSLPFADHSMDLIIQSTVFSSVLAPESRQQLAAEMYRVLNINGKIFSYDMRINNPWNRNVTKLDKAEIKRLFPEAKTSFFTLTLNPVLARRLARFSILACEILEKLPFLCSHYYAVIEKR
jgi:ubiquinone/menaquinone biosynthesis C-methylase UbiE